MTCRLRRGRGGRRPAALGPLVLLLTLAGAPALARASDAEAAPTAATAVPAPAAAEAAPRTITYAGALEIALKRNTGLQRAANSVELDGSAVAGAREAFLPDLRLNVSGSQDYGRFFSQDEGRILNQTSESLSGRVSSSATLFDGLGNVAALQQARLTARAGRQDLERARQSVVFQVASGYLALIEAREQVRIQRENLKAQEDQEELVQALVEGGSRPVSDLYQQRASVAAVRLSLVGAERTLALAELDLVGILQLDPTGSYVFEAPELPPPAADSTGVPAAADLVARALATRPDLQAQEARLAAAGKGLSAAKANRWPTLSLSGQYGTSYNSTSLESFNDQLDQRRGGSIALGLSLPVFDRHAIGGQIDQARISRLNAGLALEDLRQDIALQVQGAVLDLRTARRRLELADAQLASASEAFAATQERYKAGVATLYEVTLAQASLVQAESDLVSARFNLVLQDTLLRYYVGDLDPEAALGG